MDSIDGIIALCFTEAGIENEFHLKFGEEYNQVLNKLKKYNLKLVDIEDIKIEDSTIIDDVVKQLETFDDDF
jgi:hypothetical protein